MDKRERIEQLIKQLNEASDAYYSGHQELMSDYEWDALFDELKAYNLTDLEVMQIEVTVKYSGYIKNQENESLKLQKLEKM